MSIDIAPYIVPVKPGKPVVRQLSLIKASERLAERLHGPELANKKRSRDLTQARELLIAAQFKEEITAHFEIGDRSYDLEGRYWECDAEWKEERRWRPDLAIQTSELNFGPPDDPLMAMPLYAPFNGRRLFFDLTKFKAWLDLTYPAQGERKRPNSVERRHPAGKGPPKINGGKPQRLVHAAIEAIKDNEQIQDLLRNQKETEKLVRKKLRKSEELKGVNPHTFTSWVQKKREELHYTKKRGTQTAPRSQAGSR